MALKKVGDRHVNAFPVSIKDKNVMKRMGSNFNDVYFLVEIGMVCLFRENYYDRV